MDLPTGERDLGEHFCTLLANFHLKTAASIHLLRTKTDNGELNLLVNYWWHLWLQCVHVGVSMESGVIHVGMCVEARGQPEVPPS